MDQREVARSALPPPTSRGLVTRLCADGLRFQHEFVQGTGEKSDLLFCRRCGYVLKLTETEPRA